MTLLDHSLTKLEFEKDKLEQGSMAAQVMVENYRIPPQILEKAKAAGDWVFEQPYR